MGIMLGVAVLLIAVLGVMLLSLRTMYKFAEQDIEEAVGMAESIRKKSAEKIAGLEKQIAQQQSENDQLQSELEHASKMVVSLEGRFDRLTLSRGEVEEELAEAKRQLNAANRVIDEAVKGLGELVESARGTA